MLFCSLSSHIDYNSLRIVGVNSKSYRYLFFVGSQVREHFPQRNCNLKIESLMLRAANTVWSHWSCPFALEATFFVAFSPSKALWVWWWVLALAVVESERTSTHIEYWRCQFYEKLLLLLYIWLFILLPFLKQRCGLRKSMRHKLLSKFSYYSIGSIFF